ncbi:MAG: protein pufQ [Rhodobacteraceae bacterium]|nr:protein pufQ [Paracoccaceae bacterium]
MSLDPNPRRKPRRKPEFILYFTILFLVALPFSMVSWVAAIAREGTLNLQGPLARAWVEADRITPIIFSA